MARLRLNQELRNKCGGRFKVHFEQENTQEKEKFFQERENFKAIQENQKKQMKKINISLNILISD